MDAYRPSNVSPLYFSFSAGSCVSSASRVASARNGNSAPGFFVAAYTRGEELRGTPLRLVTNVYVYLESLYYSRLSGKGDASTLASLALNKSPDNWLDCRNGVYSEVRFTKTSVLGGGGGGGGTGTGNVVLRGRLLCIRYVKIYTSILERI